MKETKPLFRKENLLYKREERKGYWTVISKVHPEARELIINPTAKKILELSDGSRTIEDIESYFVDKYPDVPEKKIKIDVSNTLSLFSRLGVVVWNGDNPFLYKEDEPIADGYFLSIGQEDNLRDIENFIEFSETLFGVRREIVFYKSPLILSGEYSELVLRQKLFAFSEEFFLLKKNSKIEGLMSISVPDNLKKFGAIVKLLICPREFLSELFRYSRNYFPYLSVRDITKLEVYELSSNRVDQFLIDFLDKEKFNVEAKLKDEAGFGNDLIIYSLGYEREFIKTVEEQRNKF